MITGSRRLSALMNKDGGQLLRRSIIGAAIVGVIVVGVLALVYPDRFFSSSPAVHRHVFSSHSQANSSSGESSERINTLKSELAAASEKNAKFKRQIKELTEKNAEFKRQIKELTEKNAELKMQIKEQRNDQPKAGPFGTVKALRTNPTVAPDESVNPGLAKLLEKVAVNRELIVALANSNIKDKLELWFASIKRVGIPNYLVFALDEETASLCRSNDVPVYMRDAGTDKSLDSVARTTDSHAVSALKFQVLREFLQLGYSVLLSDADIIYLQNPFEHLYRDSDVESMTDGHNNGSAYGYIDIFDEPKMGWSRYVSTTRIWVFNSGFFYIRPTIPAIELLDRVSARLARENAWDQAVFNEELFYPSHPGYEGLHASKRTMDYLLFMNSHVLFNTVRKDAKLRKLKPVIIHLNYHPDKIERLKAVVEYYVNGKQDALDPFTDGSRGW